jgi:hypothetical protein
VAARATGADQRSGERIGDFDDTDRELPEAESRGTEDGVTEKAVGQLEQGFTTLKGPLYIAELSLQARFEKPQITAVCGRREAPDTGQSAVRHAKERRAERAVQATAEVEAHGVRRAEEGGAQTSTAPSPARETIDGAVPGIVSNVDAVQASAAVDGFGRMD